MLLVRILQNYTNINIISYAGNERVKTVLDVYLSFLFMFLFIWSSSMYY